MPKHPAEKQMSILVEAERIGPEGLHYSITATPAQCTALARRFGILKILSLSGEVDLRQDSRIGHYRLQASLLADVEQACIVSLEPVREQISEDFERFYARPELIEAEAEPDPDEDIADWLDPEAADPPDPLENGRIDIGEALAEELALSLNPYPRRPDATLPETYVQEAPETATIRPFAALAKLKKTPGSDPGA